MKFEKLYRIKTIVIKALFNKYKKKNKNKY